MTHPSVVGPSPPGSPPPAASLQPLPRGQPHRTTSRPRRSSPSPWGQTPWTLSRPRRSSPSHGADAPDSLTAASPQPLPRGRRTGLPHGRVAPPHPRGRRTGRPHGRVAPAPPHGADAPDYLTAASPQPLPMGQTPRTTSDARSRRRIRADGNSASKPPSPTKPPRPEPRTRFDPPAALRRRSFPVQSCEPSSPSSGPRADEASPSETLSAARSLTY